MYASIAVWTFRDKPSEDDVRRTEREVVEPFSQQPGFVAYYSVRTGELEVTTFHVWNTHEHADAAIQALAPALQRIIGGNLAGAPVRSGGDIVTQRPL